jgi:hypothetical protein
MKFHEPFLRLNYKLLREFSKDIRWIIINNDDVELEDAYSDIESEEDAVGSGVTVEAKELRVKGNVAENSLIKASLVEIEGQTHKNSKIYAKSRLFL